MMSVPDFMWALLLLLVFGVLVPVLPFMGRLDPGFSVPPITGFVDRSTAGPHRPALPSSPACCSHLALAGPRFGPRLRPPDHARVLRSSLLGVYHDDYIRQARLRGIGEGRILLHHALKQRHPAHPHI